MSTDAFSDGIYSIADVNVLEARTQEGHKLVRILPTSSSMLFLLQRSRDQHHEDLRKSIEHHARRADDERALADKVTRELDVARRDLHEAMIALSERDRELLHEKTYRGVAESARNGLEFELAKMRRMLDQVRVVFGEDGGRKFDEHLIECAMGREPGGGS